MVCNGKKRQLLRCLVINLEVGARKWRNAITSIQSVTGNAAVPPPMWSKHQQLISIQPCIFFSQSARKTWSVSYGRCVTNEECGDDICCTLLKRKCQLFSDDLRGVAHALPSAFGDDMSRVSLWAFWCHRCTAVNPLMKMVHKGLTTQEALA